MKINIPKFQIGGGMVYSPLRPTPENEPVPKPAEPSVDLSFLDAMVGKVLPNDYDMYEQSLKGKLSTYASMPRSLKETYQGRALRDSIKDIGTMVKMDRSRKTMDEVLTTKKDALPEQAMTTDGKIIVEDLETGTISQLSLPEYYQNIMTESPKFRGITNSELLQHRELNPSFSGNTEVFNIVRNGRSMNDVVKDIKERYTNLGKYTEGKSDVSYEEQQIEEGAKAVLGQGIKYSKTTEGDFKASNRKQLEIANNAMWGLLPEQDKNYLRLVAMQYKMYKPEQIENAAMGLAMGMANSRIDETIKVTEGIGVPGKSGGKTTVPGTDLKGDIGYNRLIAGFAGSIQRVPINTGGDAKATVVASVAGGFQEEGQPIGVRKITDIKSLYGMVDLNALYMGGTIVPKENAESIVYDGGAVNSVLLPFKNIDGHIVPDLTKQNSIVEAESEIEKKGNISLDDKKAIYESHGIRELTQDGFPSPTMLRPFVAIHGTTTTGVIKNPDDTVVTSNNDGLKEWYKQIYTVKDKVTNKNIGGRWIGTTDMVEGMVYMPLSDGAELSAMLMDNTKIKTSEEHTAYEFFQKTRNSQIAATQQKDLSTNRLQIK